MIKRSILMAIVLAMACSAACPVLAQAGEEAESWQIAARGPILWHSADDEKRQRMENDLELLRLYNEAMAAKTKRKKLGNALFYPGAVLIGAGFAAGLFQNAIGLYDGETGEYLMVGGVALGAALAAPGIYFTRKKSDEEERYEQYLWELYREKPIMKITPIRDGVFLSLRVPF